MTPYNNFSVLPFYTSIEQQNARKWWIAGKVYPLFTPMGQLLPFQIIRPNRSQYVAGEIMQNQDYDSGYIDVLGNWLQDNTTPAFVAEFDVTGKERVYISNLAKSYRTSGTFILITRNIAFRDVNGDTIKVTSMPDDYYTGVIDVPDGAVNMLIQEYNEQVGTQHAQVYEAIPEPLPINIIRVYKADGTLYQEYDFPLIFDYKVIGTTDIIIYSGAALDDWEIGQYYIMLSDGVDTWYSDIFTVIQDVSGYLKLEWWDDADFIMDAGAIVYTNPAFKNTLYLISEIAKPEYNFTEEIIERDGYTFPVKQVSEKKYRFSFLAPEYLLDVLRFVRMSDHVAISKDGQTFVNVDTFLITPEWESAGDVAVVNAEFTTDTVAKKNGHVCISN